MISNAEMNEEGKEATSPGLICLFKYFEETEVYVIDIEMAKHVY